MNDDVGYKCHSLYIAECPCCGRILSAIVNQSNYLLPMLGSTKTPLSKLKKGIDRRLSTGPKKTKTLKYKRGLVRQNVLFISDALDFCSWLWSSLFAVYICKVQILIFRGLLSIQRIKKASVGLSGSVFSYCRLKIGTINILIIKLSQIGNHNKIATY